MKHLVWIINLVFALTACNSWADVEVIADFSEDRSLAVLNNELRRLDKGLEQSDTWYSKRTATTLIIASGAVTVTQAVHAIDTQDSAASDDLDTINGGAASNIVTVYASNSARTVVLKDGTGNLKLSGDITLDNAEDTATLIKIGLNWHEITNANNGA